MIASSTRPDAARIHPGAAIGAAALTVTDVVRAERFYVDVLGLGVLARGAGAVVLGAGGVPLLTLTERSDAIAKPRRSTGLFHVAILVPTRRDLGTVLRRVLASRYRFDGAADHLVSEALYLSDPDGNGLEIAVDRPARSWAWSGDQVQMATVSLDLAALLAAADSPGESPADPRSPSRPAPRAAAVGADVDGLPAGTRIGHLHLQVAGLQNAERFYRDLIGFDVTQRSFPGALFVSAGRYHHHVGLNTWAGVGAPAPPAHAVGLRRYALMAPTAEAVRAVAERLRAGGAAVAVRADGIDTRDGDGNGIRLTQGAVLDVPAALALAEADLP